MAVYIINFSPVVALNSEMPNKIWFGKNVKYDYLRVLAAKLLCMFQRIRDPNWMQSQGSAYLLVMVRMNLVIGYMILLKRSLLEVVMSNSWKIKPLKTLIMWRSLHPRKTMVWLIFNQFSRLFRI